MSNDTPMIKQYKNIKKNYPNDFVFFRMGDFYELFYDDAIKGSSILNITLTKKNIKSKEPVPMAGIPFHSAENYISKLVSEGFSVVICEQIGEVQKSQLVERAVSRIITPSTVSEEELISPSETINLVSVFKSFDIYSVVELNMSNGTFVFSIFEKPDEVYEKLKEINPSEIIFPENLSSFISFDKFKGSKIIEDDFFNESKSRKILQRRFLIDKKFINSNIYKSSISAAGSILRYIEYTQNRTIPYIKNLKLDKDLFNLKLDSISIKNLELIKNNDNDNKRTLLTTMNKTNTSIGSRKLKDWILHPSIDENLINKRLDTVEKLINKNLSKSLSDFLIGTPDIERILTRIALKTARPRDLSLLRDSLDKYPLLKSFCFEHEIFQDQINNVNDLSEVCFLLKSSVVDMPPQFLRDGNVIKDGFNKELDDFRSLSDKANDYLIDLEEKEKEKTGIDFLKFSYNKIDGFYISIPKGKLKKVPDYYLLKKNLKNENRYTILELKNLEEKILSSNTKALNKEKEIFDELLDELNKNIMELNIFADFISTIDVLNSFSIISSEYNYCRPIFCDNINIVNGRHPVVEKYSDEPFIQNDLFFNDKKMILLTGPNMGGKSTYMRQNAIIILMAHMGCFVPADSANIKLTDRIFTRIGSGDNLSEGVSTFMQEMLEAANILNNVSDNSFVIIDEIGRGTSTYDGLSLAWGIASTLSSKCLSIFSTHYFELIHLEDEYDNIFNMHMMSKKFKDEVIFLHKISKGFVDQSYGIEVAKIAGLDKNTLKKSMNKLDELKNNDKIKNNLNKNENKIIKELKEKDLNNLTPIEALAFLEKIQKNI